jgi:hypothetical protein
MQAGRLRSPCLGGEFGFRLAPLATGRHCGLDLFRGGRDPARMSLYRLRLRVGLNDRALRKALSPPLEWKRTMNISGMHAERRPRNPFAAILLLRGT